VFAMKRIAKYAFAALALLLCLAVPVAAQGREMHQNFLDANAALDRGEYATALRLYRSVADYGYINAQEAQVHLGDMYDIGLGVPRDYAEAMRWYRLAADEGYDVAQWSLGNMYEQGHGVPQDYEEAVRWYRQAADQELPVAQYYLGFMYANGHGVPQDYILAHMWFNLSAAHGNKYLKSEEHRDEIARLMTRAQIAEAQKLARDWKPKR
jgi:TPR repeat protein